MPPIGYDEIAGEYYDASHVTSRNFDAVTSTAIAERRPQLPTEGLILDVGCGRGRCHEYLGVPANHIVQLDASEVMLGLSEREECLLRLKADASFMPFYREQFAAVVGFLADAFIGLNFLAEAFRVLQKGGLLLITVPTLEWGQALRAKIGVEVAYTLFITRNKTTITVPSTLVPTDRLSGMLSHSGFQDVSITAHALPKGVTTVSTDITTIAESQGVDVYGLPLLLLATARKPT